MSALGQKQTNRPKLKFKFVPYCPKADKRGHRSLIVLRGRRAFAVADPK